MPRGGARQRDGTYRSQTVLPDPRLTLVQALLQPALREAALEAPPDPPWHRSKPVPAQVDAGRVRAETRLCGVPLSLHGDPEQVRRRFDSALTGHERAAP